MNNLPLDTPLDVVAYDDKFNIIKEKIMTNREYLEVIKKPTRYQVIAYKIGYREGKN